VKVRGPVTSGDYILPSGQDDGVAVAVPAGALQPDQWAQVAGRAWESNPQPGVKRVMAAVSAPSGAGWWAAALQDQAQEIRALRAAVTELQAKYKEQA
jgi:hypothetical protein